MFHKFQTKIKYAVTITSLSIVAVYLIAIFLLYSRYLRQDYLQKVSHINLVLSQSIEAHLNNIEESALPFSVPLRDNAFYFRVALDKKFRNMISSNSELTNMAFFTDEEIYYYKSMYNTQLRSLIESMQENISTDSLKDQWIYIAPDEHGDDGFFGLFYIHPIMSENNTPAGCLILFPSPSIFTESLKPLQDTFTDDITSCLRFDNDHFTPILSKSPAEGIDFPASLHFSETEYTRLISDTFFISIPLERFGLCFQTAISLQPLYQKQLTMVLVLSGIFLVTAVCVKKFISAYSQGLVSRLETLMKKIDTFSIEQKEENSREN